MSCTVGDTLEHLLFTTRHIRQGDVQAAILLVLMELGIPEQYDGFYYLRRAVYLKYKNESMNLNTIQQRISEECGPGTASGQIHQAINAAIGQGWNHGDPEAWNYYVRGAGTEQMHKPTINALVCRLARVIELWCSCSWEVDHER